MAFLGTKKEEKAAEAPPAKEEAKPVPMRKFAGHDHPADSFVTVEALGDGALNGHAYRAGDVIDVPATALDHFLRTGSGKLHYKPGKALVPATAATIKRAGA